VKQDYVSVGGFTYHYEKALENIRYPGT